MSAALTAARAPIQGPCAWRGAELREADWLRHLPAGAAAQIDGALAAVKARGLDWPSFGRDDFPLPDLGEFLAETARELEQGRGFLRLRGLAVGRYTDDDLRRIFWGLAAHLGTARYQNAVGELIGEVRDEVRAFGAAREAFKPAEGSAPLSSRAKTRSNGLLRFHTDRCDAIALLCVRAAKAGGTSKLVSAVAVHNEILARRPDLLEVLYGDYYRCRLGEEKGGETQAYRLPVFAVERGHFTTQYSRTFGRRGLVHPRRLRARRSATDQQPRDLSRPRRLRGRRGARRGRPAAAAHLARHAQQPAPARGPRGALGRDRSRRPTRRHRPAGVRRSETSMNEPPGCASVRCLAESDPTTPSSPPP
jgi:hypothetical protein